MVQELKIGIRFKSSEEESQNFWRTLIQMLGEKNISTALIDLSGKDLLFNAISCMQAENRQEVYQTAPRINTIKCKYCGTCIDFCETKAISMPKGSGKIFVEPEVCTDCGACYNACGLKGAIEKGEYLSGLIEWTDRAEKLRVFRVAFRKKWLLRKKGIPQVNALASDYNVKIFGIDADYCGKSFEQEMDYLIEIRDESEVHATIKQIISHIDF